MSLLIRQVVERETDQRSTVETFTSVLGTLADGAVLTSGLVASDIKRIILRATAVIQSIGTADADLILQKASPGGAVATIGTLSLGGTGTAGTATAPTSFVLTDTLIAVGDTITAVVASAPMGVGTKLLVRVDTVQDHA
jgi:hypothetical protein